MVSEGEYLEFTITNTFSERRSFYWYLSAISGSINDSDFAESAHSLERWSPKRIDIDAGETKQIRLLIADDKLVEKIDKFKQMSRFRARIGGTLSRLMQSRKANL